MKKILKSIFHIVIVFILIFISLYIFKSKKRIFEDIIILGFLNISKDKEVFYLTDSVEIDIFSTIESKYKNKIAPGSSGEFTIKFKKNLSSNYKIEIEEKSLKPKNLIFSFKNQKYSSLKEIEEIINKEFIFNDEISIKWKWEYYIDEIHNIQDTIDAQKISKYIFEIKAIVNN